MRERINQRMIGEISSEGGDMNFKEAAEHIIENGCSGIQCSECPIDGISDVFCEWCQDMPQ